MGDDSSREPRRARRQREDRAGAQARWTHRGGERPAWASDPGPGQESVWDYPRPPRIAPDAREVVVEAGGVEIARTRGAVRVLETASPPTFYLPPGDVRRERLVPSSRRSFCEWKGEAQYWSVETPQGPLEDVAWSYPDPTRPFRPIAGWIAFYPGRVECHVDGERVRPQPGRFYGGWVTDEIVGPMKGEPGTEGW